MDLIAFANELINKYYSSGFLGYFDSFRGGELAVETSRWVLQNRPDVAYTVLSQLRARGFASSDIVHVARGILDAVPQQNANNLAQTADGNILIRQIGQILKYSAPGNAKSPRSIKIKTALDLAKPKAKPTGPQPRQLSQIEMDWYVTYNTKHARSTFNRDVCWDLPENGIGFTTYNVDDFKNDKKYKKYGDTVYGYDQIGTKETVDAMIRIAEQWNSLHADRLLQYGDIARPGGIDTPDHGTHMSGKEFDMRPLRNDAKVGKDGKVPTPSDPGYHRDYTKEFILLVRRLYPGTTFYFNDEKIYLDKQFSSFIGPMKDHDNHIHVMLKV